MIVPYFYLFMLQLMENIHQLDIAILEFINVHRIQELDGLFILVTDSAWVISYFVPALLILYALISRNYTDLYKALTILISVILSFFLVSLLKHYIDRPRPFAMYGFIQKVSDGGSPSFPSGHSSDAFAFVTALCIIYSRKILLLTYIWAFLLAYSRMHLGVHYPSDVIAGVILGICSAIICCQTYKALVRRRKTS